MPGLPGALKRRDVSVNPIGEPSQYRFGCRESSSRTPSACHPVLQGARVDIALQKGRSQDFAEPSLTGTLPQFHLKQAIWAATNPLRKEKVVLVVRVNVCNTPFVAQNTHRLAQSLHTAVFPDTTASALRAPSVSVVPS